MVSRNMSLKGELVKQCRLIDLPRTHHRFISPPPRGNESAISFDFNSRVFQQNRHLTDIGQRMDVRFAPEGNGPDLAYDGSRRWPIIAWNRICFL
jgi:hypothetical protein